MSITKLPVQAAPKRAFISIVSLFYIWGLQGAAAALFDIFAGPAAAATIKPLLVCLAVLASMPSLYRLGSAALTRPGLALRMILPALLLAVTAAVIRYLGSGGPFFLDLFRALTLAAFYLLLGAFFGKRFLWLGLWLIALTVLLVYRYLGFAPIVLEGYGGLSLIACACMLQAWFRHVFLTEAVPH